MRELGLKLLGSRSLQLSVVAFAFVLSVIQVAIVSHIAAMVMYVVLSLVTLRKGLRAGAYLLAVPCVGLVLLAVANGSWIFSVLLVSYLLVVYGFSVILHLRDSWRDALVFLLLSGFVAIFVAYELNPDLRDFWREILTIGLNPVLSRMPEQDAALFMSVFTSYMTGFVVFFESLQVVVVLVLARVWQSSMFNVGGFKQEFQAIRVNKWMPIVAATPILMTLDSFSDVVPVSWSFMASDVAVVAVLPLVIAGLSLMHAYIYHRGWGAKAVWFGYILLLFLQLYFIMLLCVMAMLDSSLDFRTRGRWRIAGNDSDKASENK